MTNILIVDDHPIFRAGAASTLSAESDLSVVGEASNTTDALELILTKQPDLVLMDIRLDGDVNGIGLAMQIRANWPEIKIIVLTNYSYEPYIRAMMEAGVEGYLLKDVPPTEVIHSVRMVMDGRSVFSALVIQKVVKGYLGAFGGKDGNGAETITERETAVLELLANGVSNSEIAERLNISVATVQFHLTGIYGKLGVRTRSEALVQAARQGLVVLDE